MTENGLECQPRCPDCNENGGVRDTGENSEGKTYNSQLIKRPRRLNILQRLRQRLHLMIHPPLRLLRALHRLSLKRLDGFQLPAHIIRHRLEGFEMLFDFINHGAVVERGSVFGEVDRLRLLVQGGEFAAGVVVALFEGLEGRCGAAFQAEGGGDSGPVDFGCGGALGGEVSSAIWY